MAWVLTRRFEQMDIVHYLLSNVENCCYFGVIQAGIPIDDENYQYSVAGIRATVCKFNQSILGKIWPLIYTVPKAMDLALWCRILFQSVMPCLPIKTVGNLIDLKTERFVMCGDDCYFRPNAYLLFSHLKCCGAYVAGFDPSFFDSELLSTECEKHALLMRKKRQLENKTFPLLKKIKTN